MKEIENKQTVTIPVQDYTYLLKCSHLWQAVGALAYSGRTLDAVQCATLAKYLSAEKTEKIEE